MRTIQFDYRIGAEPDRVFAELIDFERMAEWRTLESVRLDPAGPLRVGTKIYTTVKNPGPGGPMRFVNEVTKLDSDHRRYDDRWLEGTFVIESGWEVEPEGDGTLLRWTTRYEPRGTFRLMAPFLGGMIRKGQEADLAKFARRFGS